MAVYFIQGKLGAGKSMMAVRRIRDALEKGVPVATNLDLRLEKLLPVHDKGARVYRLPDQPRLEDFELIGYGNLSYDEERNGALVLDECASWFNSREWNKPDRKLLNEWLRHARKYGWDVYIIGQDVNSLDSQARNEIMEHLVTCKRTDRLTIPFFGLLFKLLTAGQKLPMPRGHVARVEYMGTGTVVDRWFARGDEFWSAYDTKQVFSSNYLTDARESGVAGTYMLLPGYYVEGFKRVRPGWELFMRLSRLYFRKLERTIWAGGGALVSGMLAVALYWGLSSEVEAVEVVPVVAEVSVSRVRHWEIVSVQSYELHFGRRVSDDRRVMLLDDKGNRVSLRALEYQGYDVTKIGACEIEARKGSEIILATCTRDGESV